MVLTSILVGNIVLEQTVYIVDDEVDICESVQTILKSVGVTSRCFSSGTEFLRLWRGELEGCVMLDMRMPGLSGMEVLAELHEASKVLPVVLFTSYLDVQQTVDAMKAGAFDYIPKPFTQTGLVEKVRAALEYNSKLLALHQQHLDVVSALSQLTTRERQVLDMIVEGRTSKNIASALGISSFTVDNHRARILDKMRATTTGQLVQMVCTTIALLGKS